MKVTISDIAKAVGVSTTTISRYLNGNYNYMSAETRRRIEEAIREYNYVPNNIARTLKSKHSGLIGIIVNTLRYQVAAQTLTGINEVCMENGYGTVIYSTNDEPDKEDQAIEMCMKQQVEGIVVIPCRNTRDPYLAVTEKGIPVVLCTRQLREWPYSMVYVRHDEMIRNMVSHLKDEGFEKVRFLLDVPNFHKTWMGEVFAEAAKEAFGMDREESIVFVGREDIQIGKALDDYLQEYPGKHKAIMAVNTHTLFVLLKEIEKKKCRIPEELGVCGYDSIGWAELVSPGISAMRQPMKRMGRMAGTELVNCLKTHSMGEKRIALDGSICFRASTKLK